MCVEGLTEYDPDGVDARAIEAAIEGVHVIRHGKCRFAAWLFDESVLSFIILLQNVG